MTYSPNSAGLIYPTFERKDLERENLKVVLSHLSAHYVATSQRLQCKKKISSIKVITETQFFSEGDWWALTLLSLTDADGQVTLAFLPIMHTIIPEAGPKSREIDRLLTNRPELIAYGMRTESPNFGVRNWVAYDAFLDKSFAQILLQIFWGPQGFWDWGPESDGDGEISFATSLETTRYSLGRTLKHRVLSRIRPNGDVVITCGNRKLFIPRVPGDMRRIGGFSREEVGRIEYRSDHESILIAVLF